MFRRARVRPCHQQSSVLACIYTYMFALALLLFKLSTLFFLLLLTVAYLRWDFVEAAFRHALSFAISKKIGTRWSCDKITLRSGSIAKISSSPTDPAIGRRPSRCGCGAFGSPSASSASFPCGRR